MKQLASKQTGGGMEVWIEASGIKELGEVQVLFAGTPAKTTTVQEKLITAEISPEQLTIAGKKDIAIKIPVGVFYVLLPK